MGIIHPIGFFGAQAVEPNSHSLDLATSAYAYKSSPVGIDYVTELTIELWVNPDTLPSSGNSVGLVGRNSITAATRFYLVLANVSGTYYLRLHFTDTSPTNHYVEQDVPSLSTGTWTHLACALAGTSSIRTGYFYKNGSSIGSDPQAISGQLSSTGTTLRIGADWSGGGVGGYDGHVDDVRIWAGARSSGDISANYDRQLNGNETDLDCYYKFNNSYDDETSNGNDLTAYSTQSFETDVPF